MRSVVCPECAAMVPLPIGLGIPDGGRLLSCGRCSTIWRIHLRDVPPEPPPPPTVGPTVAAATTGILKPRRARARKIALVSLVGILACGALIALAFLSRHHLAVWMPSSRGIFLAVGATVKPSSVQAAIMGWQPVTGGALLVGYRIANPTALSQTMPEICVEGRSEDGEMAFRRCFSPDTDKLLPDTVRDAEFLVLDIQGAVRIVELRTAPAPR